MIKSVDVFVIYDDVNYIKGGWINRNTILENRKKKLITLETRSASQNKPINQILVGNNTESLIKTLTQNYSKAPYFNSVIDLFTELLRNSEKNLAKFITYTISKICLHLGVDTKLIVSSENFKNSNLRGVDRIIDICKQLGGSDYINSIGGRNLYNKELFAENNLELFFIKSNPITYPQYKNTPFVQNLSIIDVMMFNATQVIQKYLDDYSLI